MSDNIFIENELLNAEMLEKEENLTSSEQGNNADDMVQKPRHKHNVIGGILGGSWISDWVFAGNAVFLIFITLLAVVYIANKFAAEDTKRQIEVMRTELEELRTESISISAMLMETSRQSKVYQLVQEKELGLEALKTPPYKIVVFRPP